MHETANERPGRRQWHMVVDGDLICLLVHTGETWPHPTDESDPSRWAVANLDAVEARELAGLLGEAAQVVR